MILCLFWKVPPYYLHLGRRRGGGTVWAFWGLRGDGGHEKSHSDPSDDRGRGEAEGKAKERQEQTLFKYLRPRELPQKKKKNNNNNNLLQFVNAWLY